MNLIHSVNQRKIILFLQRLANQKPAGTISLPPRVCCRFSEGTMVDGRRRGLFGKALCLAAATVSGGLLLGAANLPLAGAATSSSSSGGGGVPDSACSGVKERCLADPFCTGCTTGIGSRRRERSRRRLQQQSGGDDDANGSSSEQEQEASTELCSSRYPILVSGSGVSFCERVGAAKCCEFSDNDTASTCLEDSLTAEYW